MDAIMGFEYNVDVRHPRDWPEPWQLLSANDAAKKISITTQTFRQWATDKDFPPVVNLGDRQQRWLDRDIDLWIEWKAFLSRGY